MRKHYLSTLAFLLFSLLEALSPAAAAKTSPVRLDNACLMYFGADPALGISEISSPAFAQQFTSTAGRPIWTGVTAPSTWLKVTLPVSEFSQSGKSAQNLDKTFTQRLLVIRPSFSIILDNIDIYVQKSDGGFDHIASGASSQMPPAEIYSRFFAFALPQAAFQGNPCYIRLSSRTDVLVDIDLETATGFAGEEGLNYALYGIVYGVLIAMVLYSFFLLISLKDIAYLFYIFYTTSVGLWLFFLQGHAKALLGQKPLFDQAMLWFWVGGTITWGSIFTSYFLRLKNGRPYLMYIFAVLAALGGVVSLSGLAGWDRIAFSLSHFLGIVLPIFSLAATSIRLAQGLPSSFYFLIAWFFLSVGGLIFALMGLKVLPVDFFTTNAIALGATIESILFAMALADRFKRLEAEREKLAEIESHYRELNLNDALTGLHNKRFLSLELELATAKSRETGTALSILLVDVDNIKNINDLFGNAEGDQVLVSLAGSIRSCTRESDRSCRLGGDEFVIIMPGVPGAVAFNVAERIRTRFERESQREVEGEKLTATISVGVAEYDAAESWEAFLARADDAMYEAKKSGKNRSYMRAIAPTAAAVK